MAKKRGATKSKAASGSSSSNNETPEYSYVNYDLEEQFWSPEAVAKISLRRNLKKDMKVDAKGKEVNGNKFYNSVDLMIKIEERDENGKMIRKEDGTVNQGLIILNKSLVYKVMKGLEQIIYDPDNNSGLAIKNMYDKELGNGVMLELFAEDDGFYIKIINLEGGEETESWVCEISGETEIAMYDGEGNIRKDIIDTGLTKLYELFIAAYHSMTIGNMVATSVRSYFNKKKDDSSDIPLSRKRPTVGKAISDEDVEEGEDDEEDAPAPKKVLKSSKKTATKKKASGKAPVKSLKQMLEEDDDEDE